MLNSCSSWDLQPYLKVSLGPRSCSELLGESKVSVMYLWSFGTPSEVLDILPV